jgi:uncharacterized membrane protein
MTKQYAGAICLLHLLCVRFTSVQQASVSLSPRCRLHFCLKTAPTTSTNTSVHIRHTPIYLASWSAWHRKLTSILQCSDKAEANKGRRPAPAAVLAAVSRSADSAHRPACALACMCACVCACRWGQLCACLEWLPCSCQLRHAALVQS